MRAQADAQHAADAPLLEGAASRTASRAASLRATESSATASRQCDRAQCASARPRRTYLEETHFLVVRRFKQVVL